MTTGVRINHEIKANIQEGLFFLATILAQMGITELRISKEKKEIFWDIETPQSLLDVENRFHESNEKLIQQSGG